MLAKALRGAILQALENCFNSRTRSYEHPTGASESPPRGFSHNDLQESSGTSGPLCGGISF